MNLFRPRTALSPNSVIEIAGRPVRLRVNARARRISLRVDARKGEVVATAPSPRRLPDAVRFAESRADWIVERLAAVPTPVLLRAGLILQIGGEPCRLERAAMRIAPRLVPATAEEPMRLIASGEGEAYGRAALRGLKAEALSRLTARTAVHTAALGRPLPLLAVADARGRWGSCNPGGPRRAPTIRYSWRLLLTPPEVIDYVAAHEVAHLVEANHGERFWRVVHDLYGDPSRARRWLRTHGAELQAISV